MSWITKISVAVGLIAGESDRAMPEETKRDLLARLERIIESSEELKDSRYWKVSCQGKYLEQSKLIFVGELKEVKKYLERDAYRFALRDFLQAVDYKPQRRDFDPCPEAVRIRREILDPMGDIYRLLNTVPQ